MSPQTYMNHQTYDFCTVVNCSTVKGNHPQGPAAAAALDEIVAEGWTAVEFWWPFDRDEPNMEEVQQFCQRLSERKLRLHALNLWGGDMAAGHRGVLDREPLSAGHLAVVAAIAQQTNLRFSNTLLGRSGQQAGAAQLQRLADVVKQLSEVKVTPLVEPLSGMSDYPVVNPWQADEIARRTGAGVLADFYHFAANGVDVDAWLSDVESGKVALPDHVQVADFPGRGAPGTGQAPLAEWIERLRTAGYQGEVAGEWLC